MKASQCMFCKYWKCEEFKVSCKKGHKPRYYKPRVELYGEYAYYHDPDWGWKRRCKDYKETGKNENI